MAPEAQTQLITKVLGGSFHEVLMRILRHLDQHDIEQYLTVFPKIRGLLKNMEPSKFPEIQRIEFSEMTIYPFPAKKLYSNIYLKQNLLQDHPTSRVILENQHYLREITFANVNLCDINGTILEKIIHSDFVLEKIVFEHITFCKSVTSLIRGPLVANGAVHVRNVDVKGIQKYPYGTGPFLKVHEIKILLLSLRVIETLYLPRSIFDGSISYRFLMRELSNIVHSFSLQNAVFTHAVYKKIFKVASLHKYILVDVNFDSIASLSELECERYFASSIKSVTNVPLTPGLPTESRVQLALRLAGTLHIHFGEAGLFANVLMCSPAQLPRNHRILKITGEKFPEDITDMEPSVRYILSFAVKAFGSFDIFDTTKCKFICKTMFQELFGEGITRVIIL